MSAFDPSLEPMLEMFLFETQTLLDNLDEIMLNSEKEGEFDESAINEIFRIMHTIKGSSAMMGLNNISSLAHNVEDMFFVIRENPSSIVGNGDSVFDCVFASLDFLKQEVEELQEDYTQYEPSDSSEIVAQIVTQLKVLKGEAKPETPQPAKADAPAKAAEPTVEPTVADKPLAQPTEAPAGDNIFKVKVYFEEDSQMENIRAFMLLNSIKDMCDTLESEPPNPETSSACSEEIVAKGFLIKFTSFDGPQAVYEAIEGSVNIKSYEVLTEEGSRIVEEPKPEPVKPQPERTAAPPAAAPAAPAAPKPVAKKPAPAKAAGDHAPAKQNLLSVNQSKLDQLMELVGEIVIAEGMVASNPDLKGLSLDNFSKATRQLRKLTDELQDVVMSIRMVPLNGLYQKMNRIVRDMSKKLGKDVDFVTLGGDTEIDKTIIDSITDPFMHMIRNSMDHGIETDEDRQAAGKKEKAKVTLSAQNIGGEIVMHVMDNGKGLNPEKLLAKAKKNGLLTKNESEYTDKEIFNIIMLPGFSTNEAVTEYSGRGVGMDVVRQNIEKCSGSISVESVPGEGTTFTIKIPLTLAIVDGMDLRVNNSVFTIPITSIKQSFKVTDNSQLLKDIDGNDMIMIRGECYPIICLHDRFGFEQRPENMTDGILVLIENNNKRACLYADELLGEQQVVVKPFPAFLNRFKVKENGLAGCSILSDGSISLILDSSKLLQKVEV